MLLRSGNRVPRQGAHGIVLADIPGQPAILSIGRQQTSLLQTVAHAPRDGVGQSGVQARQLFSPSQTLTKTRTGYAS